MILRVAASSSPATEEPKLIAQSKHEALHLDCVESSGKAPSEHAETVAGKSSAYTTGTIDTTPHMHTFTFRVGDPARHSHCLPALPTSDIVSSHPPHCHTRKCGECTARLGCHDTASGRLISVDSATHNPQPPIHGPAADRRRELLPMRPTHDSGWARARIRAASGVRCSARQVKFWSWNDGVVPLPAQRADRLCSCGCCGPFPPDFQLW
jgi:hypothetical protein